MKMHVIKRDGSTEPFDFSKVEKLNEYATRGLNIDVAQLQGQIKFLVFDGMKTADIFDAQVKAAAGLISRSYPDYTYVAARYLLCDLYKRVTGNADYGPMTEVIKTGIADGRYSPKLGSTWFDMVRIERAIKPERDFQFDYFALQNIVDRYLMRTTKGKIIELPQQFFMRVAMGMAINEPDRTGKAIEFYELLSTFRFMSSTPTLFNSGTVRSQLSSCYLNVVADQISSEIDEGENRWASIYGTIEESARLSKYAGGIGTSWTRVRGSGSLIKGTNGKSSGVIPYLKVYNDTAVAVNQGGKRKGSFAPYLEPWHPDFWNFCELKKEFGDDRLRAHDIYPAAWLPDLFMERVRDNGVWSTFDPHSHPDLHELHGDAFKARYEQLEGEGKFVGQRPAVEVWRHILTCLFETGHPWVTFKDECNRRNPQDHVGVIHSSNLCCIAADQRVVTDQGMLTVGELFKRGGSNVVMGMTGPVNAGTMLLPRPDAPMVRIETAEGYSHKVTPDHRVWLKGTGWIEAQDLKPGDQLLIQQGEGLFGDQRNVELGLVAGLIAGDGTFSDHSVHIDLWDGKTAQFATAIEQAVARVIVGEDLATSSTLTPRFRHSGDGAKARLNSAPLKRLLETHGFTAATKLKVPDFVWRGDRSTVAAYLRGLYLTDGNVQSASETCVLSLASVGKEMLQEIQILWANFGVKTSICKLHDGGLRDFGKGGVYDSQLCWRLLITSIQGCKIAQRVTLLGEFRNSIAADHFVGKLGNKGYQQKLWATFTGLRSLPKEDAYCLTVESDTHAWTVNGMITHNTEITLNTSDTETAVCNLGSVNLAKHIVNGELDLATLQGTVTTAVRMLDNVIDLNYYPSDRAKASNMRHRPIGLGVMGYTEALVALGIDWESERHLDFANWLFEHLSAYAIGASADLAEERGAYPSYEGSKWSKGVMPVDTARSWSGVIDYDLWREVRERVSEFGMRNSNIMAIAPTATISIICGTEPCIEPLFEVERVEGNMSGKFKVISPCARYGRPELLKTVWDIDPSWVIRAAAVRQRWIDQSQSVNIFVKSGTKGQVLAEIYMQAWKLGLKTTYYLRTQSKMVSAFPSQTGEAKLARLIADTNLLVPEAVADDSDETKFCSLTDPGCEACQ